MDHRHKAWGRFAYAARALFDPDRLVQADARHSYGEDRYQLIGRIEQRSMKTVRMTIDPAAPATWASGRMDPTRVDATTERGIALQHAADEAEAMQDAAKFARRVRKRLGLSQADFSERIDVPLDTVRNWEQGKRSPTGAAKALLKVLDKAPEAALAALH